MDTALRDVGEIKSLTPLSVPVVLQDHAALVELSKTLSFCIETSSAKSGH